MRDVRMTVSVNGRVAVPEVDWDEVQDAVAHATLGEDSVGTSPHRLD